MFALIAARENEIVLVAKWCRFLNFEAKHVYGRPVRHADTFIRCTRCHVGSQSQWGMPIARRDARTRAMLASGAIYVPIRPRGNRGRGHQARRQRLRRRGTEIEGGLAAARAEDRRGPLRRGPLRGCHLRPLRHGLRSYARDVLLAIGGGGPTPGNILEIMWRGSSGQHRWTPPSHKAYLVLGHRDHCKAHGLVIMWRLVLLRGTEGWQR